MLAVFQPKLGRNMPLHSELCSKGECEVLGRAGRECERRKPGSQCRKALGHMKAEAMSPKDAESTKQENGLLAVLLYYAVTLASHCHSVFTF